MRVFQSIIILLTTLSLAACDLSGILGNPSVSIEDAWVAAMHPGQEVTAAYLTLTSPKDVRIINIESDLAENVEMHHMSMKNDVMEMHKLDNIALQANKPLNFEDEGLHLMLIKPKQSLNKGMHGSLTLTLKWADGAESTQTLSIPVREDK